MFNFITVSTRFGILAALFNHEGVHAITIAESIDGAYTSLVEMAEASVPGAINPSPLPNAALKRQLNGLITGITPADRMRLCIRGTPFQERVWSALCTIPRGYTETYGGIASRLGLPASAARAIGSACGANMFAIAVPCHRVVRTDGGLGGYRWGLERKAALLQAEAGVQPLLL